jgi:hypothetical protein
MSYEHKKEQSVVIEPAEKTYTKRQLKTGKTVSRIAGMFIGAAATIATGVILSKTAKVNLIDAASKAFDSGVEKIKGVPSKLKKDSE